MVSLWDFMKLSKTHHNTIKLFCKSSILYRDLIQLAQDEYQEIYLAIKDEIYDTFFQRKSIKAVVKLNQVALLVINTDKEEIVQWIN